MEINEARRRILSRAYYEQRKSTLAALPPANFLKALTMNELALGSCFHADAASVAGRASVRVRPRPLVSVVDRVSRKSLPLRSPPFLIYNRVHDRPGSQRIFSPQCLWATPQFGVPKQTKIPLSSIITRKQFFRLREFLSLLYFKLNTQVTRVAVFMML